MKLQHRLIASVLFLFLSPMAANATPITYSVFDDLGSATISGSITTDGTIGNIANANITDWNIFLDDGTNSGTLTSTNSVLHRANSSVNFTATPTDLSYDYTAGGFFFIYAFSNDPRWCLGGPDGASCGTSFSSTLTLNGVQHVSARTGASTLGSASSSVPEPGTLALLAVGFGCMYRRRASAIRV